MIYDDIKIDICSNVKVEFLGNYDLYNEYLYQYKKLDNELNNILPIKITKDNINKYMIERKIVNLNKAVDIMNL